MSRYPHVGLHVHVRIGNVCSIQSVVRITTSNLKIWHWTHNQVLQKLSNHKTVHTQSTQFRNTFLTTLTWRHITIATGPADMVAALCCISRISPFGNIIDEKMAAQYMNLIKSNTAIARMFWFSDSDFWFQSVVATPTKLAILDWHSFVHYSFPMWI